MKAPKKKPTDKIETKPSSWDSFKEAIHEITPPKKAKVKPKSAD
jgi:hypothetical protein